MKIFLFCFVFFISINVYGLSFKKQLLKGLKEGNLVPSIYYSYPFSYTLGIGQYFPKKKEFTTTFIQTEIGQYNISFKGGIFELAPVGFGYSLGPVLMQVFGETGTSVITKDTTYTGVEASIMFSLIVFRINYLIDLKSGDSTSILSAGIGLF